MDILLCSIPRLQFEEATKLTLVDQPSQESSLETFLKHREEATRLTLLNLLDFLGGREVREFVEQFLQDYPCKNGRDVHSDVS